MSIRIYPNITHEIIQLSKCALKKWIIHSQVGGDTKSYNNTNIFILHQMLH